MKTGIRRNFNRIGKAQPFAVRIITDIVTMAKCPTRAVFNFRFGGHPTTTRSLGVPCPDPHGFFVVRAITTNISVYTIRWLSGGTLADV